MTPCEKLGYTVGDRFEVISGGDFTVGSIVELLNDDHSSRPLFKLIEGDTDFHIAGDGIKSAYTKLSHVKKLPKETPMDALIKARETYGQAKESLEQALKKVREDYPWLQIDIREDVHRDEAVQNGGIRVEQPKDLPWTEWQEGDVVECYEGGWGFTKGHYYVVFICEDGEYYVLDDDNEDRAIEANDDQLKFHSRPGQTK